MLKPQHANVVSQRHNACAPRARSESKSAAVGHAFIEDDDERVATVLLAVVLVVLVV